MFRPHHGDEALRRHRTNAVNASYFLTLCTTDRRTGLHTATIASALHAEITAIETSGHWQLRGAVVMPDHLHLLVKLTGTLEISRCVARLKSKTNPVLLGADLIWQSNFYEHRLRADESVEPVLRYLYLNPYHENLVPPPEAWPWFWLGLEESGWFVPLLEGGKPLPEWLR